MARRRSRGLGSSAAIHTARATGLSSEIDRQAAIATNKARNGRCTAALLAYADMQRAIGSFEAESRGGGKAWRNTTAVQEAAREFSDRCVRVEGDLSGARRRRRR